MFLTDNRLGFFLPGVLGGVYGQAMVAAGDRTIVEVVLLTEGTALCPPCGRCRQQLSEFAGPDTPVHLCGPEGVRRTLSLQELLPLAFGPDAFGRAS